MSPDYWHWDSSYGDKEGQRLHTQKGAVSLRSSVHSLIAVHIYFPFVSL